MIFTQNFLLKAMNTADGLVLRLMSGNKARLALALFPAKDCFYIHVYLLVPWITRLDQSHHMSQTYDAWSNNGVNEVEAGAHNGACVFPLRSFWQLFSPSTVTLYLDHREKEEVTSQGHTSLTTGIPHWISVPLYLVHPPVTCVYRAERRRWRYKVSAMHFCI